MVKKTQEIGAFLAYAPEKYEKPGFFACSEAIGPRGECPRGPICSDSMRSSDGVFAGGLGALADAGGLAGAATQIIELGAADLALAHDDDRIHQRRIDREDALHAFAIGHLAHGEAL